MNEESGWIVVKILTPNINFQNNFISPSDFFRKLTNSKMGLGYGIKNNNRMFWKRHFKGGVYYFIPSYEGKLEIIFLIEMVRPERFEGLTLGLKSRIKRLLKTLYTKIEITKIDLEHLLIFENNLTPFNYQRQFFGECYKRGSLL